VEVELSILTALVQSLLTSARLDKVEDNDCPLYTGEPDETREIKCARALCVPVTTWNPLQ
jgi:hypothetical protein